MICQGCGVEYDNDLNSCPLCGDNIEASSRRNTESADKPKVRQESKEIKKHVWELSTILTFSAIFVCTIVDQVTGGGLGWSLFTVAALITVWSIITIFIYLQGKPYLILPLLTLAVLFLLFLIDLFDPGQKWFAGLGLPITLSFFFFVMLTVFISNKFRMHGFNLLGVIFIFIALFCISIELFKDSFVNDQSELVWSLITSISILPLALIFLFLHYRMKKGKRLDSFFHV